MLTLHLQSAVTCLIHSLRDDKAQLLSTPSSVDTGLFGSYTYTDRQSQSRAPFCTHLTPEIRKVFKEWRLTGAGIWKNRSRSALGSRGVWLVVADPCFSPSVCGARLNRKFMKWQNREFCHNLNTAHADRCIYIYILKYPLAHCKLARSWTVCDVFIFANFAPRAKFAKIYSSRICRHLHSVYTISAVSPQIN